VVRWRNEPVRLSPYGTGSRRFIGENPPRGPQVYYSLTKKAEKISMKIVDYAGKTVRDLSVKNEPGLHLIAWQPQRAGPGVPGGRGPGGLAGALPPPGMYRVVMTVDGKETSQPLKIEADPTLPARLIGADLEMPRYPKRGEGAIDH
jgi:hypothetical protein